MMRLFNRNDIEIEMHGASVEGGQPVKSIRLRKADDTDKCKELLDKCAELLVHKTDSTKSRE